MIKRTLAHHNVADALVDVDHGRVTGLDHVAVAELHALGTLGAQLARNGDFATASVALHDETEHTIAGPTSVKNSQ